MSATSIPVGPEVALERQVGAEAAQVLLRHMHARGLDVGEVLVDEGSSGEAVYLVLSGELSVELEQDGRHLLVCNLGPETWVGEASFLDGAATGAIVRARTVSTVLTLDQQRFHELISLRPETGAALVRCLCRVLAQRIHATNKSLLKQVSPDTFALSQPEVDRPDLLGFLRGVFGGTGASNA